MKSQRQLQVGETIKRIIAEIFARGDLANFPGAYLTVLEADISPDLKNVKIFMDIFGEEKQQKIIIEKLNEMAPQFRFHLSKKLTTRIIPEIVFMLDKTQANAMNLESLIATEGKKINKS